MTRFLLAAGVAALAIAAPAAAQGQKQNGKGQSAEVERGGGKSDRSTARGSGRDARTAARSARTERRAARLVDRGPERREARAERRVERAVDRGLARAANRADRRVQRSDDRVERRAMRADDRVERRVMRAANRDDRRELRADNRILRDRDLVRVRDGDGWFVPGRGSPLGVNGCPPGLMNKAVPCVPPGQVGKQSIVGSLLPATYRSSMLPLGLRDLYRDDDDHYYRLGNGYVYKVDRESQLVRSLLPLIGAGLGLGQVFPATYANSYVPNYYQPFYRDNQDDYYRYANGYVYEIDRSSGMIEDMIPLMAGGYGVGQLLPAGYSAYNVPYQYRSTYYDSPDAYYRYAPGAIYQVDPTTQLITAVASLLAPGSFGVGQQLPMGYNSYNVPLGYRDQYYDTADNWYRYNNGYIYQVDPTTQLITAAIRALV